MEIGTSLARAALVAAAAAGRLPAARPNEARSEAARRLGRAPWNRSGMRLSPGHIYTGWSEESRRIITRIGVAGQYDAIVLPTEVRMSLGIVP